MPTFIFPLKPNARAQPLPKAGATQERTLEAVSCTPWFGWGTSQGGGWHIPSTPQR